MKWFCFFLMGFSLQAFSSEKNILVILSSQGELPLRNERIYPTGFYLNELMLPVKTMLENNLKLTFATPNGLRPFLDKSSDDPKYFRDQAEYLAAKKLLGDMKILEKSGRFIKSFGDVLKGGLDRYSGIFIPGGHAPMVDLAFNKKLGKILKYFHFNNLPTALLCHGPVALLSTLDKPEEVTSNRVQATSWIYKGYKMAVFSNEEEKYAEQKKLHGKVLYYPESSLRKAGGVLVIKNKWKSNVVVSKELITGQNPASERELTIEFIKRLAKSKSESL